MKITSLKILAVTSLFASAVLIPAAADEPNGLAVKVDVVDMGDDPSHKTINFLLHILNVSDHPITVLTKGLEWGHDDDGKSAAVYTCTVGYEGTLTHDGHLVIPSLSDLGPVTLNPNEEALANYELDDNEDVPALIKKKTPIAVTYRISQAWAKRLGIWSGSITAASTPVVPFGSK